MKDEILNEKLEELREGIKGNQSYAIGSISKYVVLALIDKYFGSLE